LLYQALPGCFQTRGPRPPPRPHRLPPDRSRGLTAPHGGRRRRRGRGISSGHRIDIEIQQANGARARVVGTIDRIPLAAGGEALQMVITDATVEALPPKG
jgi:hypothetical protein